jgi:transcriptional regulator with XRE-family HTH domain
MIGMENATLSSLRDQSHTIFDMARERPATRETVARNLKALLRLRNWSQAELARQANLPTRTVNAVVNMEGACTVETAEKLAAPFGLHGWHLLIPDLPDDLMDSPTLSELVESYASLTEGSRELLNDLAAKLATK